MTCFCSKKLDTDTLVDDKHKVLGIGVNQQGNNHGGYVTCLGLSGSCSGGVARKQLPSIILHCLNVNLLFGERKPLCELLLLTYFHYAIVLAKK